MKYHSLTKDDHTDSSVLRSQFDAGHQIGVICVAKDYLFVRKGFKTYYIAYGDADRIFRRVRMVNASVCCDNGEFRFDYLVVYRDGKELLEVQLPGEKAARMLLEELKDIAPECEFCAPEAPEEEEAS